MEEKQRKAAYGALLAVSGLFAAGAVATLIPNPAASWPNVLGYKSLCTFAPIATAVCALLAGATCTLRVRLFGPSSGRGRPWFIPIFAAILLLAVIVASLPAYVRAKVDSTTSATMEE
jgi:hypothetical protein